MKYGLGILALILLIVLLFMIFRKQKDKFEICTNPYYKSGSTNGGINNILPQDNTGQQKWLSIFPVLDPTSWAYQSKKCQDIDTQNARPDWAPGCTMWGSRRPIWAF